jgi:ABC-type transport system involved in Fe-S cluster assembly fused permease/ATPase subunit
MRFYDPTAGSITLDGLRLSDINLRSLHMNTGLVAQDTQLFGKVRRKQSLFASTFHINVIILPRQAPDKHRGKSS